MIKTVSLYERLNFGRLSAFCLGRLVGDGRHERWLNYSTESVDKSEEKDGGCAWDTKKSAAFTDLPKK